MDVVRVQYHGDLLVKEGMRSVHISVSIIRMFEILNSFVITYEPEPVHMCDMTDPKCESMKIETYFYKWKTLSL